MNKTEKAAAVMLAYLKEREGQEVYALDLELHMGRNGADASYKPQAAKLLRNRGVSIVVKKRGGDSTWCYQPDNQDYIADWNRVARQDAYSQFVSQARALAHNPRAVHQRYTVVANAISTGVLLGKTEFEVVEECEPLAA